MSAAGFVARSRRIYWEFLCVCVNFAFYMIRSCYIERREIEFRGDYICNKTEYCAHITHERVCVYSTFFIRNCSSENSLCAETYGFQQVVPMTGGGVGRSVMSWVISFLRASSLCMNPADVSEFEYSFSWVIFKAEGLVRGPLSTSL